MIKNRKETEETLFSLFTRARNSRVFPGCVCGITDINGNNMLLPFGRHTYQKDSALVTKDSVYDVASITKSIPTSSLALKLVEEDKIRLDDNVKDYIPELSFKYCDKLKIEHLLTHTVDFGYPLSALKQKNPRKILNILFSHEISCSPGESFSYSNGSSILLGILIERIIGCRLENAAEEYFFKQLGMESTYFYPDNSLYEKIVPTEIDQWRGREIRGEVHDESAFVLRRIMTPGSAGLFSNARDLLCFLSMLLNSGAYKGKRILDESTAELIQKNRISHLGQSASLGWELNRRHYMGKFASEKTIGKTGFTGCVVMCDFLKKKALVLLSNYTYPVRKADPEMINRVRSECADIVFGE